jgi:hypothetical protein
VWVLELGKVGFIGLLAQTQTSRGAPQTQNCGLCEKNEEEGRLMEFPWQAHDESNSLLFYSFTCRH